MTTVRLEELEPTSEKMGITNSPAASVALVLYVWDGPTHLAFALAPDVDTAREMVSPGWHERMAALDAASVESVSVILPWPLDAALHVDPVSDGSPTSAWAKRDRHA